MLYLPHGANEVECHGNKTHGWYAWNNLMPPKPDDFHVIGCVEVGNPGVEVYLCERTPQGPNEEHIQLDILLYQKPGPWPGVVTTREVTFSKLNATYKVAEIFCGRELVEQIKVDDIQ